MTIWAVLAGGQGSRYGQPKATASFRSSTFLDHCLSVVGEAADESDTIAVSVAHDWVPDVPAGCIVVADALANPGPAHSIARLAEVAAQRHENVVFMADDMLGVTSGTLRALRDRVAATGAGGRPAVVVAAANGRSHWVLGAIPAELAGSIVANESSVAAVQVLLQLCPIEQVDVPADELLDVNTPELRPDSQPR